jgi:hypothetical protein
MRKKARVKPMGEGLLPSAYLLLLFSGIVKVPRFANSRVDKEQEKIFLTIQCGTLL